MPRSPRLSSVAYSFGPGPVTPAVRALLIANVAVYLASLVFPAIVDWLGLIPRAVIEDACSGSP